MTGRSPASSPRLPSPPPIAEDQVGGPTSPGFSLYEDHGKIPGAAVLDLSASRRIRPGSTADDMAEGPPLTELQDIDSAFQLTEYLKALHYAQTHPPNSTSTTPITHEIASQLAQPPPSTSKEIWLYELGRFLIQKTNAIIVALFADSPPCSAHTCPEMRASEWQYLCAVHDPPKSCSAIDYCCHTLDWAATSLTSSKMFPSRLGLGSGNAGGGSDKILQQQMKEITNIFRRVYRIYAHAWFQHREMFWRVESKTGLYVFFKTVCDEYGMIQPENYTIPSEAEGGEPMELSRLPQPEPMRAMNVLKREEGIESSTPEPMALPESKGNTIVASGDTSKRHRHTMSDRGSSISTVIHEEVEDEEEPSVQHLPAPSLMPEESTQDHSAPESSEHTEPSGQIVDPGEGSLVSGGESAAEGQEEEPIPGMKRSETIKPPKEEPLPDVEDEGDVTEFKIEDSKIESEVDPTKKDDQTSTDATPKTDITAADIKADDTTATA